MALVTAPVSRETWARAETLLGPALPSVARFARILTTTGVQRGLIGPRESDRIWERHLLNCAVVERVLPRGAVVADIGSGAGLPGLVLALVRPDLTLHLVESLQRRTDFLRETVQMLALDNVHVVRDRAENLAGRLVVDVVTARAVAPLDRLAGWCLPLVRPGGSLVAMKGAHAPDEVRAAEPVLRRLGATRWSIEQLGAEILEEPTTVVRVTAGDQSAGSVTPDRRSVTRTGRRPPRGASS